MMDNIDVPRQNLASFNLEALKNKNLDPAEDKELKDACAGFEAIFLQKILEAMRDTLDGDALFGESNSSSIYTSMHDQHLAEQLSHAHTTSGLKDFLYNQLKTTP